MPLSETQAINWVRAQTWKIPHSGVTLFDHLFNTYCLLKDWHLPYSVRMAGLCHSVYETKYFTNVDLRQKLISRQQIQVLIGVEAEDLVHWFCTTENRTPAIIANSEGWPRRLWRNLLYIELANYEDQVVRFESYNPNVESYYRPNYEKLKETLNANFANF